MIRAALLIALMASPLGATAQSRDASRLDGRAAQGVSGVASLNLAAGTGNAQANVRAIASGEGGLALAHATQSVDVAGADLGRDAQVVISGGALGRASGIVGLNQAAGTGNAQANLLAIGPVALASFVQQVDNDALAATSAPTTAATAPSGASGLREARIDAGAIAAPSGVLQINQTAGVGNASTNAIVLQLPGGTP